MTGRGTWTDERISEKMDSIDSTFNMLREEIQGLRADNREQFAALRADSSAMRGDLATMRGDISALQRLLVQIGFGLVGVLLSAMVALIVALA